MLVAQAAHQASAGTRDLLRIERELLVLRRTEVHRAQIRQPRCRAVLASASTDTRESLRFVAHTDLLQFNASTEHRGEIAHEAAKVDATLSSEEQRELAPVPLPLGVGQLHHEMVRLHSLHRLATRVLVLGRQLAVEHVVGRSGESERGAWWRGRSAAVRAAVAADFGQLASGVHATKILTTVSLDDHPRLEWGCRLACPGEELLPVAAERDFDEMRHGVKATR